MIAFCHILAYAIKSLVQRYLVCEHVNIHVLLIPVVTCHEIWRCQIALLLYLPVGGCPLCNLIYSHREISSISHSVIIAGSVDVSVTVSK